MQAHCNTLEYAEGWRAYFDGESSNPYGLDCQEGVDWAEGWKDAKDVEDEQ